MKKVQVLQNLAAKIVFSRFAKTFICYRGFRSAGLGKLNIFFNALNGLVDWDFNFYSFKDNYNITLGVKITFVGPMQSRRSWGQNRFIYQAGNDWNILSNEVENF